MIKIYLKIKTSKKMMDLLKHSIIHDATGFLYFDHIQSIEFSK